jgi:hypothetical protein
VHRALLVGERQHRGGKCLGDRSDLEQGVGLRRPVVSGVAVEALRARICLRGADRKARAWRRLRDRLVDDAAEGVRVRFGAGVLRRREQRSAGGHDEES